MQREKIDEKNVENDEQLKSGSRAARILQERAEKRRRKASLGKLISYIIALILVILLMWWLRRSGM